MQVCAAHRQWENTRDETREQWVLRERFVVVVALVFVFVSETRVSSVSLVTGNVIGLYRATVFITIRARKAPGSWPAPLKNTIWFITNHITDVARCRARSPFMVFERKVCSDKCTRHSAMRRSCLDILHDICIFRVSLKTFSWAINALSKQFITLHLK